MNSRLLPLEGAVNVRDVGGHRSAFGAEVAPGRVLRGDALSRLPQADIEKLGAVGLRTGQALHQLRGALLDQLHLVPLSMINGTAVTGATAGRAHLRRPGLSRFSRHHVTRMNTTDRTIIAPMSVSQVLA